ncbi:ribose 1,5-bisphosphokinase, partial [Serratia marcescens]
MARLIYLMGPSGAGKDSLLAALRADADRAPLVAHRYITRPADAGCENHIALSEPEFLRRRAKGLFALDWQAHQQRYAFGIEVDLWLLQGIDVAVNGSRAHLPQAQQRYGAQLLPVCLQVSAAILRQRLQD